MMRAAKVELVGSIKADPQEHVPPFMADIGNIGPVAIHHGQFVMVGEALLRGVTRIQVAVGASGCGCGCGAPARAIMYTPAPEHARFIAAQLIAVADQIDAAAADQAAAALRRAGGK